MGGFDVLSSLKDDESIIYVSNYPVQNATLELINIKDIRELSARRLKICPP